MASKAPSGPRSIALIGPFSSGKTSLLENLLFAAGAISRKGTVKEGNMVGDASTEAHDRQMSVEISAASFDFMGEPFTILDCPGSLEFLQETLDAVIGVDAAIVVVEPEIDRAVALAPLLHFLGYSLPSKPVDVANLVEVERSKNLHCSQPLVRKYGCIDRLTPVFERGFDSSESKKISFPGYGIYFDECDIR